MNKYTSETFALRFYEERKFDLHYRPGMTPEEREQWKAQLKAKVQELMAFPDEMYETPIVNLLLRKDRGTHIVEKYEISPEPNLWMTFLLLTPKSASEEQKTPAVLCTPGTRWNKECLAGEDFQDLTYDPPQPPTGLNHRYYYANAMALHYVHHGFTALACEDLGVGEHSAGMKITDLEKLLIGMGRSVMGVTVELRYAMMQWLKTRPWVDRSRLAVSGHSLGVDSLMHLVTLDEEITGFIYNDWICDWQKNIVHVDLVNGRVPNTSWHMYSEIYKWYTYPDLLAAYAPRKLFITEGGAEDELLRLKQVYTDLGAGDNFRYDFYREYQDPEKRKHLENPLRRNMTEMEYVEYNNVFPDKHFFKFETAVPWLVDAMK